MVRERILFLTEFKEDIQAFFHGRQDTDKSLRPRISRSTPRARSILLETRALKRVALAPPAAIGGLVVNNADPFDYILQDYYGMSLIPTVSDMIEEAIGVLQSPEYLSQLQQSASADVAKKTGAASLAYPEKMTLRWLIDHAPLRFWLLTTGAFVSILLAVFAWGFRLGQDPRAVEALSRIPGLERSSNASSRPMPQRP